MIKSEIINEILKNYEIKRNFAITKSENNITRALEIEEYKILDKKERALTFEIGKLKFEQKDATSLLNEVAKIQQEKLSVLKKYKIKPADLKPKFECNKCKDTGYSNNKLCTCVMQKYNSKLMEQLGIDLSSTKSLKEYDYSIFNKDKQVYMKDIVNNLLNFVKKFEEGNGTIKNIVLVGGTGVGKTYLAQSIAKEILSKGYTALFTSSYNLNNAFLQAHTSKTMDKMLEINAFLEPDLLIIDDLGTEPMLKNITKEYLLLLISERVIKNKRTIITTNLMPDHILNHYGERIFSRMFDKSNSVLANIVGKDIRIKK